MDLRLKGKGALVTGSTGGIGFATACALLFRYLIGVMVLMLSLAGMFR